MGYQKYHWVTAERFEELVYEALEEIPDELWSFINNLVVVVEARPSPDQLRNFDRNVLLLGLYQGVPLTVRGHNYGLVLPDKITIFRESILRICPLHNEAAVRRQVRRTVLHEIAHHFGISDERLLEIGAY